MPFRYFQLVLVRHLAHQHSQSMHPCFLLIVRKIHLILKFRVKCFPVLNLVSVDSVDSHFELHSLCLTSAQQPPMAIIDLVNQPNVTDFNPTIIRKLDFSNFYKSIGWQ